MTRIGKLTLVAYVLSKTGCIHPFRLSRILALAEIEWLKKKGERLSDITYVKGPGTFYIEELKEAVENDPCFEKKMGDPSTGRKGCVEYKCKEPSLPADIKSFIDEILERTKNMEDFQINNIVMNDELFQKIAKEG